MVSVAQLYVHPRATFHLKRLTFGHELGQVVNQAVVFSHVREVKVDIVIDDARILILQLKFERFTRYLPRRHIVVYK